MALSLSLDEYLSQLRGLLLDRCHGYKIDIMKDFALDRVTLLIRRGNETMRLPIFDMTQFYDNRFDLCAWLDHFDSVIRERPLFTLTEINDAQDFVDACNRS